MLFLISIWNSRTFKKPLKTCNLLEFSLLFYICLLTWSSTSGEVYHNEWAVEILGGSEVADQAAFDHGFVNLGKILHSGSYYRFSHPRVQKRSLSESSEHHSNLVSHPKVLWAEQQIAKSRRKRDLISFNPDQGPNDPMWSQMWYLLPTKQPSMRVLEAWKAGYTGKNVAVTILDDGIEYTHDDLKANYDKDASGDINANDDDPIPRLNPTNENKHGTRCAGEVAASANNGVCSVGVAFNAKIGGVRMLDGPVTDAVEAASIGLKPQNVDIYSASWGPDDDGRTVDGPAKLAKKAFHDGVILGRGGKGSIFVWASGNGGRHEDNCNCDGYTNSIYTLSISSTTESRKKPWYSESCSSTLASTYSSGTYNEKQIVTTDLLNKCTNKHTGTSASAPLAAGLCALALEANSALTWRDMQHLVVGTARADQLDSTDWTTNGVGRKVSHAFGYGLMDAYAMVKMASNWTLVPKQRVCNITAISPKQTPRVFSSSSQLKVPVLASACDNGDLMIERLEHVQAVLTLRNQRRGDLTITLKSPKGTESVLLGKRRSDMSSRGFTQWPFMTTHSWDEDPRGEWTLAIRDHNSVPVSGTLSGFSLILYGTLDSDWPDHSAHGNPPPAGIQATASANVHEKSQDGNAAAEADSNAENCKQKFKSGNGCLVCSVGFMLDPDTHKCLSECRNGHYAALQGDSKKTNSDEEQDFSGLVCSPCADNCHSCVGPHFNQCVQCNSGAQMLTSGHCVMPKSGEEPQSARFFYMLTFALLSLLAFLFALFYVLSKRWNPFTPSGKPYAKLPSEDGALARIFSDSGLEPDYHDYDDSNGALPNGQKTPLIDQQSRL